MKNDIEILPTIGESLSIKTVKQGRRQTVSEYENNDRAIRYNTKRTAMTRFRKADLKTVIVAANRILKFEKSSDAQKKVAQVFLDYLNCGDSYNMNYNKKVLAINGWLARTYGDNYLDCNVKN